MWNWEMDQVLRASHSAGVLGIIRSLMTHLSSLTRLNEWYHTPLGIQLQQMECQELSQVLGKIQGQSLLQIGGSQELQHSALSPIQYRLWLSDQPQTLIGGEAICGHLDALPFLPNSIDVIVVVHALEWVKNPRQFIHHLYRSLTPGGKLFILNFNPLSLWGIKRWVQYPLYFPKGAQFWCRSRIEHWLCDCGFDIIQNKTFTSVRWEFLEILRQICCSGLGMISYFIAEKRASLPLLRSISWWERLSIRRAAEPTTRAYYEKND